MGPHTRTSARDDLAVARAHVRRGLWLTWFCAGAGIVYSLLTPGSPNRPGLIATFSGGLIVATIVNRANIEPILPGRRGEPFFIGWSNAYIALTAVLCLIDGGVGSPLAYVFFVPILFAALGYERLSGVAVAAFRVTMYAIVAATTGGDNLVRALYPMVVLVATAIMGLRYATTQADQRVQLEASEERYRRIIETANEAVCTVDADGAIAFANGRLAAMVGLAPEAMLGRPLSEFIVGELPAAGEGTVDVELRHREGPPRWALVSTAPLPAAGHEAQLLMVTDITDRKLAEARLKHQALHDPLTDLPNRRFFLERLGEALADRRRGHMAVLLLDLDGFKLVNDTLGHGVGDQLLRAVSARLTAVLRDGDVVARLGGDEFVVICPRLAGPAVVEPLAERIASAWARPLTIAGRELATAASIGI